MGYDDTGKHYQDIGELGEATRAFTKERECAQTPTHVGIMLQRLINVAIEQQNWLTVESNVQKVRSIAQSTPSAGKNEAIYTALLGLAQMSSRNYNAATGTFLSVNNSLLQNKPEALDDPSLSTLTSSDIATYGALCAMATLDRSQLQSRVLDNANFRAFLEVEPHLRRCVTAFISGKFASCLSILDSYRPDYLLDLYLAPHFMELFDKIRSKAIVQYFVPFSVVTFKALAEAFNTTEEVIETSLIELIKSNSLPGRLDLENGTLLANKVDSRNAVHAEALRTAKAYERTIHLRILRMEAMHNQLEVGAGGKQPQSQQHYQDTITAQEQGSFATPFQGMGNTLKGAGQKFFGGPQG
jgi:COP9 signalosome complex subunit 1